MPDQTTTETAVPEQPDGIADDSFDLPDPARAAERVRFFLEEFGDGMITVAELDKLEGVPPLYSRDLEALRKAATDDELIHISLLHNAGYGICDSCNGVGFRDGADCGDCSRLRIKPLRPDQTAATAVPELYLSPTHGLIDCEDGVWWRYEKHRVSLRHDGLPNERPADAVRLGPAHAHEHVVSLSSEHVPADTAALRVHIAEAFRKLDAERWGYDNGFTSYGGDEESDSFVDAAVAVIAPALADLSQKLAAAEASASQWRNATETMQRVLTALSGDCGHAEHVSTRQIRACLARPAGESGDAEEAERG